MVSLDGGSAGKVDDVTACRVVQDGGYALPWQRYDNNKMAAICYYGNVTFAVEDVYTELVIDVFYIFNSTVID